MWQSGNMWKCEKVTILQYVKMWQCDDGFQPEPTWMHFSSRPSIIFLSFSVMIPASSMWPRVGNRFFTWADEAELESIVTRWFALEQSRVNDVSKRSSKELRVVENWHCVLAMAQERRTSKAARYIIRLDWFWKSFETFTFCPWTVSITLSHLQRKVKNLYF